jgi:mycothiol synthase
MNHTIQHRSKSQLEPEFIRRLVDHGNRHRQETRPNDPPQPAENVIAQMQHLPPVLDLEFWNIETAQGIQASAELQILHMDTNQQVVQLNITVEPHLRRQGIGREMLRLAAEHTKAIGRSLILTESSDRVPAGEPFLERFAFRRGQETHVNQLVVSELPHGLLKDWTTRQTSDYSLEIWQSTIPESDLLAFAELSNVMNSAPKDDLELEDFHMTPELLRQQETIRKAGNGDSLTAVVRHASGALVGLSELGWNNSRASIVSQGGTGVKPEHRNHGLGRWLKAANLKRLLEVNPHAKFIRTGNADSNAAMLKINFEMGFKPYVASISWQADVASVLERLQ